ncbi:D-ribose pyranase [Brachybacterium avium]|uniref:D-ribose pyranase n=1 Tax=Brachybacterium avium TaxID=2017485 RepID=A0A220UDK7_9MICO|nr:D-ribose pyranase [Brachybacterium avium]ASK66209.1 D-ribose pyranase [Brachybacterium avium]
MKRRGILHPELSAHLARLGHTDTFVIGDCGLPIPPGVARVDLAVTLGVPGFAEVTDSILAEIEVEAAVIAAEAAGSPAGEVLRARFPGAASVAHEEFKQLTAQARFVVRTGETTPFSNVIVRCGVPF